MKYVTKTWRLSADLPVLQAALSPFWGSLCDVWPNLQWYALLSSGMEATIIFFLKYIQASQVFKIFYRYFLPHEGRCFNVRARCQLWWFRRWSITFQGCDHSGHVRADCDHLGHRLRCVSVWREGCPTWEFYRGVSGMSTGDRFSDFCLVVLWVLCQWLSCELATCSRW